MHRKFLTLLMTITFPLFCMGQAATDILKVDKNTRVIQNGDIILTNRVDLSNAVITIKGYNINALYTNSYTLAINTAIPTNFALTNFNFNTPFTLVRGRMYIADTNNAAAGFSKTNTVTFSDTLNDGQGKEYWQADMLITSQFIKSNMIAGATNVFLNDSTMVTNNNLIFINGTGGSNEFVRVNKTAGILPGNVQLKGTNLYPHIGMTNCFNRVAEFGGFRVFNIANTNIMYCSFDFGTNLVTNVNIRLDLEYIR